VNQKKNSGAEFFFIEMTKLLIRQKCNKCFWAVFVSVSQDDPENLHQHF